MQLNRELLTITEDLERLTAEWENWRVLLRGGSPPVAAVYDRRGQTNRCDGVDRRQKSARSTGLARLPYETHSPWPDALRFSRTLSVC